MYPDFYYLFKDWFGIEIPFLSLLKTFGFLVALSFLAAAYTLYLELKRKEGLGLIPYSIEQITTGKKLQFKDYFISGILSFLIGYKLGGLYMDREIASPDPLGYLFSSQGFLPGGLIFIVIVLTYRYFKNKKESASGEITKRVKIYPHARVGDLAVIAAISGFAGAKIFVSFENWDQFKADPFGSLFSSSGLTFYGGLIVATIALYFFAKKIKLDFRHLCDAAAPGLILAYGIGRLGCQVAGDGDWGIYNSAFQLNEQQKVVAAGPGDFDSLVQNHPKIFQRQLAEYKEIPHAYFKMNGIPTWLQAYTYPNNVAQEGISIPGCKGEYCYQLAAPVFPTPIYEFFMGLLIFAFLWMMRRKWKIPLTMFSVYLILNGLERFFIEKIRVNYKYDFGFIKTTQAEIIAILLIIGGLFLLWFRKRINKKFSDPAVVE